MAAKIIFLIIIFVMLICSCTLDDSTNQSDFNSITNDNSSFTSYPTEYTGTILAKDYLGSIIDDYSFIDGIESYEVIIPEDGVLLLTEQESLNKKYIDGDVYITYSADVSFHNVFVTGKVYCHGTLRASGESRYSVFTYYTESQGKTCAALMMVRTVSCWRETVLKAITLQSVMMFWIMPLKSGEILDLKLNAWIYKYHKNQLNRKLCNMETHQTSIPMSIYFLAKVLYPIRNIMEMFTSLKMR